MTDAAAHTPARIRLALLALALGGFGIGATEFVAMGLLPEISRDVLPALAARSPSDAIAQAGAVITFYALGVVVGAPTIAATAARFPRRRLLVALAIAFTLGTALSALAPTFPLLVAARFVAGLPHGAYFGVASLVAGSLLGPGRRGQGVAMVLAGLTVANVIGVPAITFVGQHAGWRIAYLVVAAIFALTTVAIAVLVPFHPGDPSATLRRELGALRRAQVWLGLGAGAIGFGGFFAVYSYVAPLVTQITGLPSTVVPLTLATIGVGMVVGNLAGGRFADAGALRAIITALATFIVVLALVALLAPTVIGVFASLLLLGVLGGAVGPAVQTRLMDVAGDAQTLAAALNHSALNVGNGLGAALGGAAIAAGWGYRAPAWVGVVLALGGLAVALVSAALQRRYGTPSGRLRIVRTPFA